MPTENETRILIEQVIQDNWITTPIAFDGITFKPSFQNESYIKPIILFNTAKNVNIGSITSKRVRNNGQIAIKIFTQIDKGSNEAYTLSDALKTLLENRYVGSNTVTYAGSTRRNGEKTDGYYSLILTIDFDSDNC